MKSKILVYITAYNDQQALARILLAIREQSYQINQIFICDNSAKNIIVSDDNLIVKYHPENIGIGAGIKQALEFAIKENYDFIWTFDQDSIPTPKCLENLLATYQKLDKDNYKIGIIAPIPIDPNNKQIIQGAVLKKDIFMGFTPPNLDLPYNCDAPITSGSLISIEAAKTIDLPRDDLFIDGIDLDYGYRLKQKGFHNIIVPDAIMSHNFGNPKIVRFFNKELIFQEYSALRYYYICRNHTYLETRFSQNYYKTTSTLKRIKYMVFTVIKITFYTEETKMIKIYACLLGTYHGFIGKLGKVWS